MANWLWLWPPRNCGGGCLCTRNIWRSNYASGNWTTPVLAYSDPNVACAEGQDWTLIAPCVAELVRYDRCAAQSAPARPTFAPEECPTPHLCSCFQLPNTGTVILPSSWGTKVDPTLSLCSAGGGPIGGLTGTEAPCGSSIYFCDVCNDIPPLTMVHDFTFSSSPNACGIDTITAFCPSDFTGTPCNGYYNRVFYEGTYACCIVPTGGPIQVNRRYRVCEIVWFDASVSPCRVNLALNLIYETTCYGLGGAITNAIVYHRMGFQSAQVASIVSSTVPLSKVFECVSIPSRADAIQCAAAPSTLDITFSA